MNRDRQTSASEEKNTKQISEVSHAAVLLFGGSTEGRKIADCLREEEISSCVSVATEYGSELISQDASVSVRIGRLTEDKMEALMEELHPKLVIDATHPYAAEASANIRKACKKKNLRIIRVIREKTEDSPDNSYDDYDVMPEMDFKKTADKRYSHYNDTDSDKAVGFKNIQDMIAWLNQEDGTIFSALGVKEARALTEVDNYRERVFIRILPSLEGLQICFDEGFQSSHIICMQGPFSEEMNTATFRSCKADILITKDSGKTGGFEEKIHAAEKLGMKTAVLLRPEEQDGFSLSEVLQKIKSGEISNKD